MTRENETPSAHKELARDVAGYCGITTEAAAVIVRDVKNTAKQLGMKLADTLTYLGFLGA